MTRKHHIAKGQCDLNQLIGIESIKGLTGNQKKIISLIGCGLCQATISQKMKVSRAYICTEIKKLESRNLIKTIDIYPKVPGKRSYTKFYELSPQAKGQLQKGVPEEQFTACRVHNLRKKIRILSQSAPLSIDKRASFSKKWPMRGWWGHKYWFSGKAGMPSVTLDVNPKSIMAYCDRHQFIPAKNPEEAMEIGWRSIYAAVDKFVELQGKFGVIIEVPHTGETIGDPHGGFATSEENLKEGVTTPGWWGDRSEGSELETAKKGGMSRLDTLIQVSEQVDLVALPEMFKGMIDPLNQSVSQVAAMMQGGITISQQYEQMLNFMTKVISEMAEMRKENAELKAKLGMT